MKNFFRKKIKRISFISCLIGTCIFATTTGWSEEENDGVPNWGFNLHNTNYRKSEKKISTKNVGNLIVERIVQADGNVHAYPTTHGNMVYFVSAGKPAFLPGGGGSVYAYDFKKGVMKWSRKINSYLPQFPDPEADLNQSWSRTSPAISGNILIIGTQIDAASLFGGFPLGFPKGAYVIAINRKNGELIWRKKVSNHPASIVTQSPTIYDGIVYIGIASQEEAFASQGSYPCCSFRGSMLALELKTGKKLWETNMIPSPPTGVSAENWFSGDAIWGSAPAIDRKRKTVYITTGNNYKIPEDLSQCFSVSIDQKTTCIELAMGDPTALNACLVHFATTQASCLSLYPSISNFTDAIVALNMKTGAVRWTRNLEGFDAWNVACIQFPGLPVDPKNCPNPSGPDFDFGQAPMLIDTIDPNTKKKRQLVVAGQKSGFFWALNPNDGSIVWSTASGQSSFFPFETGGVLGGHQWGAAFDPKLNRIYVQDDNFDLKLFTLKAGSDNFYPPNHPFYPNKKVEAGDLMFTGSWSALDASTGKVLWTVPNFFGLFSMGPVSAANGVVYAGSMLDKAMYAFDGKTGKILFTYHSDGHVNSAPTIYKDRLFWGTGYSLVSPAGASNKLIIFKLPKNSDSDDDSTSLKKEDDD